MAGFVADDAGGQPGAARAGTAGRGDATRAVTDLFRDHHLELVRLALVMVGDRATAEDVVQDAFEQLPRRQREVLVLRYYLDLYVAEIAATLRISPSAVRATNTRRLAAPVSWYGSCTPWPSAACPRAPAAPTRQTRTATCCP
jgi:Sigma-70, region 4